MHGIDDSAVVKRAWVRLSGYLCCAQRDFQSQLAREEFGDKHKLIFPHKDWLSNTKISVAFYLCGVILHRLTNSPKRKRLGHVIKYLVDAIIVPPEEGAKYRLKLIEIFLHLIVT